MKFKDDLKPDQLKTLSDEKQIRLLNGRLDYYFQEGNDQHKLLEDEKHIINDSSFQEAISEARRELGIENYLDDSPPEGFEEWLVSQIAGRIIKWSKPEYKGYQDRLIGKVENIMQKTNLPIGWYDYILAYLAFDRKPEATDIERENKIKVVAIDRYSVTVTFEKGMDGDDYKQSWKALKPFLKQTNPYLPSGDSLKNKIFLDHRAGLGAGRIAQKYYPREYKKDPIASRDKVKKIIARFNRWGQQTVLICHLFLIANLNDNHSWKG